MAEEAQKDVKVEVKKKKPKSKKGMTVKSKKKMAVARAVVKKGTGRIYVNNRNIDTITPEYVYELVREPLRLAGSIANEVNIDVTVQGGGVMGQAVSTRAAIAKALVEFSKDTKLKEKFLHYDRMLLVDDPRRIESKKPLGPKARAKKQLSRR